MGDMDRFDNENEPLYVQQVTMIDGDYGSDGTYWGGYPSVPLYCAFSAMNRIYVRAVNRKQAIAIVQETYPDAQFHKF